MKELEWLLLKEMMMSVNIALVNKLAVQTYGNKHTEISCGPEDSRLTVSSALSVPKLPPQDSNLSYRA